MPKKIPTEEGARERGKSQLQLVEEDSSKRRLRRLQLPAPPLPAHQLLAPSLLPLPLPLLLRLIGVHFITRENSNSISTIYVYNLSPGGGMHPSYVRYLTGDDHELKYRDKYLLHTM